MIDREVSINCPVIILNNYQLAITPNQREERGREISPTNKEQREQQSRLTRGRHGTYNTSVCIYRNQEGSRT